MTLTATRVVAAILLAVTGWLVSQMVRPLMPEATAFGIFDYVNTGLGLVVGWRVIGSRMGRGMSNAIGIGLTGGIALMFWGLFVQSAREMFARANDRRYDGPMEAIVGLFEMMIEYATIAATPAVIGTLLAGGILTAVLAERAARVWR